MAKTWIEPDSIFLSQSIRDMIGGHPLVAETMFRRGFDTPKSIRAFLDPTAYSPSPPSNFPDLVKAAERIEQAIENGEKILVWGDFDVDGQTSTALLVEALRDLGAQVDFHIPIRATEGHGIKLEILKDLPYFKNLVGTGLIITCDTGINEHAAVEYAQSQRVDVIVTDHHEIAGTLPNAYAVINPHRLSKGHPLRTLPGVGVAYKLVEELICRSNSTIDLENSSQKYLDLVALGIVADVAEQIGDTRYLLQLGLHKLRNSQRLGLQYLFEIAEIAPTQLNENHIGFSIGPRLNALGRLSDANPIIEFFTTTDPGRARILAYQLEGLNERRKLLTNQVYEGALSQIKQDPKLLDYSALVLSHPGWPRGIVGIVASRLVEKFGLPTILLNATKGESAGGSARSIEGVHITEAIATQSNLLDGFGGHAGAAGLTLPTNNIPEFRIGLSRTLRGMLPPENLAHSLKIDAFLPLSEITLDLVEELERMAPFGSGNPPLTLATRNLKLVSTTKIGRSQEHLRLVVEDEEGFVQNMLWWRGVGDTIPTEDYRFDLAYRASSNTFRGERRLQLEWIDFRSSGDQIIEVQSNLQKIEIVDYRNEPNPLALLNAIRSREEMQVWIEGGMGSNINGFDRNQIKTSEALAIWTIPPGYWELNTVIDKVSPRNVYLFGRNPELDKPKAFLGRLAGLIKHVINKKCGKILLAELAAATAQREGTVKMGLLWMEAKGHIQCEWMDHDDELKPKSAVMIQYASDREKPELPEISFELHSMLEETAAYRQYFSKAHQDSLIP